MIGNIYTVPKRNYRLVVVGRGGSALNYKMSLVINESSVTEKDDFVLPSGMVYPGVCVCLCNLLVECTAIFLKKCAGKPVGKIKDVRLLRTMRSVSAHYPYDLENFSRKDIPIKKLNIMKEVDQRLWD